MRFGVYPLVASSSPRKPDVSASESGSSAPWTDRPSDPLPKVRSAAERGDHGDDQKNRSHQGHSPKGFGPQALIAGGRSIHGDYIPRSGRPQPSPTGWRCRTPQARPRFVGVWTRPSHREGRHLRLARPKHVSRASRTSASRIHGGRPRNTRTRPLRDGADR